MVVPIVFAVVCHYFFQYEVMAEIRAERSVGWVGSESVMLRARINQLALKNVFLEGTLTVVAAQQRGSQL